MAKDQKEGKWKEVCHKILGIVFKTLISGAITVILNIIVMKVIKFKDLDFTKNLMYILLIIPFGLAIINYILSSLYRRSIWRLIPCCHISSSPTFIT